MRITILILLILANTVGLLYAEQDICNEVREDLRWFADQRQCKSDSECAAVDLPQPFGCNVVVNRKVIPSVEATLEDYKEYCGALLIRCKSLYRKLSCEQDRCVSDGNRTGTTRPTTGSFDRHGRPL